MFTGIIEATGFISTLEQTEDVCQLTISSEKFDFSDIASGDSIAVSGVCLTATKIAAQSFLADVSNETLACTNLGELVAGSRVNLEKSLRADSRLGGHLVSGHVDGLATVIKREADGDSIKFRLTVPEHLAHYIARKGSVCLDGISLTVNEVQGNEFSVTIIPHTAGETTIDSYEVGKEVNLEVDLLSRYLERLLQKTNPSEDDDKENVGLSLEKLIESGFIK